MPPSLPLAQTKGKRSRTSTGGGGRVLSCRSILMSTAPIRRIADGRCLGEVILDVSVAHETVYFYCPHKSSTYLLVMVSRRRLLRCRRSRSLCHSSMGRASRHLLILSREPSESLANQAYRCAVPFRSGFGKVEEYCGLVRPA